MANEQNMRRATTMAIIVSALGYFIDVFDLLLFSILRTASLKDLGHETDALKIGLQLLNCQMAGLLVGGLLFGILGDRLGRRSVLFYSIGLYSVCTLLNSFITDLNQYYALRFLAGVGLAGELGAGVTLVSELMSAKRRGLGVMLIATVGLMGAVAASFVGSLVEWRTAYCIGGGMGLLLLAARISVPESPVFASYRSSASYQTGLRTLFTRRRSWKVLLLCTAVGLPTYFVVGLIVTAAPEFGRALGTAPLPIAGTAVMFCYIGMALGDIACSTLSQVMHGRRIAFTVFNLLCATVLIAFVAKPPLSADAYYAYAFAFGFAVGYWALIATNTAEQFGTNVRATATTLVPNFVRAATVPISQAYLCFRTAMEFDAAILLTGGLCILAALFSAWRLREGFGKQLDFVED